MGSQPLTGRPMIPGVVVWLLVGLGLLVVALVGFLLVAGSG